MKALNRAFEKALYHDEGDDSIAELLECMGEELGCKRISIFEVDENGAFDNTYEWCHPGVPYERIYLQHVPLDKLNTWYARLIERETIVVRTPEEFKEYNGDVYNLFTSQGVNRAIATVLSFHGTGFGFCILENPSDFAIEDQELIMPGIRYILSSMVHNRNLVARLRRIGYNDALTGAGNRVSLLERINSIDYGSPVGVVSINLIGWDNNEGKTAHLEREQTLLRAGEILINMFDDKHVFRVATGEFVVLDNESDEEPFDSLTLRIKSLFREHNLLAAIAGEWRERLDGNPGAVDELITETHQKSEEEMRMIVGHRKPHHVREHIADEDGADISIPKGEEFFRVADDFLDLVFEGSVIAIVTDINYFKLYNDIFGRHAGNAYLESIAQTLSDGAKRLGGICGYIGGDNFCLIAPTGNRNAQVIRDLIEEHYTAFDFPDGFSPAVGVYICEDRRETVITLYDRALNALAEIKGDYIEHVRFYNPQSHQHQREDKLLLMNVKAGLANDEFVFYVQPQVHEKSGKVIGGEALVRWIHDGQLISPGKFIPVLEKTGYVYTVDARIWESVAKWQRSLIDRGIEPVPISVNVSKVDFYFGDIAQRFIDLVEQYDIDPKLIGIEITESAFTDNVDTILDAVKKLHDAGFHILMDDFGSGSSSLSMLHTMNLDVLKTDVQFMSTDERDNRAISIVESVISMAHLIGMSVVTEGVETEGQKENLIALGDNFAQGFFFYRPMPKEQFEELIRNSDNVTAGYVDRNAKAFNQLRFKDMVKEGLVSDTLLDNIIRAAAIFKEENGAISILQLNDSYAEMTGISADAEEMEHFSEKQDPREIEKLRALFDNASSHPLGGSEDAIRLGREGREVKMRVFLLYSLDNHRIFLSTMV